MKILYFEKPTSLKSHGSITNIVIGVKIEGVSCFRTMLCLDTTALPCRARLPHPDPRCAPCAALSDILHTHTRIMALNGFHFTTAPVQFDKLLCTLHNFICMCGASNQTHEATYAPCEGISQDRQMVGRGRL